MKLRLDKINLPTNTELVLSEVLENIGISAGICYMPDTYEALVNRGVERNSKTALFATGNGHHSVADHIQVTFIIEECSKIIAMVLNSLGCYGTSEKSGRYTVMTTSDDLEKTTYEKWVGKLKEVIALDYPNLDGKYVEKLAMENARLFLSVFTPATTMKYTVGLKDANYIIDWCERFSKQKEGNKTYFYEQLTKELLELGAKLKELVWVEQLRDHKGRKFNFIDSRDMEDVAQCFEYGLSYTTYYACTFPCVGQAIRHRTLDHVMYFNGEAVDFYVPDVLRGRELELEWLEDMCALAHRVPQGTKVGVREQGALDNFKLKCTERMCGRAQLEIMQQTINTYTDYVDELTMKVNEHQYQYAEALASLKEYDTLVRCGFMQCKEPCVWRGKKAITRLV